jgi:hypothetical protein
MICFVDCPVCYVCYVGLLFSLMFDFMNETNLLVVICDASKSRVDVNLAF